MKRFVLSAVAVVAACTVATAQRQPGGTRPATSLLPQVVGNKDLQTDLKVTDAQKEKFKDVAAKQADVTKKQTELRAGGQPDREKMTEVRAEMTKVNEEVTKVVTGALTDEQKKRVKQIEVQQMGMRAFSNEAVVKELALTEDQKKKIVEINNEVMQAIGRGTGGRPQPGAARPDAAALAEAAKKRTEATEKAMTKVAAELTDAQKTTWKGLTGEKFDLTKLTGFSGGRPMRNDQ